ncbi:hypothetical protein [Bradyrhizobium monzae]|nr:hypothetical protein [Bradyrhizobium sp. Oc8]
MDDKIVEGLDVHKATIPVAFAEGTRGGEVRQLEIIPNPIRSPSLLRS